MLFELLMAGLDTPRYLAERIAPRMLQLGILGRLERLLVSTNGTLVISSNGKIESMSMLPASWAITTMMVTSN